MKLTVRAAARALKDECARWARCRLPRHGSGGSRSRARSGDPLPGRVSAEKLPSARSGRALDIDREAGCTGAMAELLRAAPRALGGRVGTRAVRIHDRGARGRYRDARPRLGAHAYGSWRASRPLINEVRASTAWGPISRRSPRTIDGLTCRTKVPCRARPLVLPAFRCSRALLSSLPALRAERKAPPPSCAAGRPALRGGAGYERLVGARACSPSTGAAELGQRVTVEAPDTFARPRAGPAGRPTTLNIKMRQSRPDYPCASTGRGRVVVTLSAEAPSGMPESMSW